MSLFLNCANLDPVAVRTYLVNFGHSQIRATSVDASVNFCVSIGDVAAFLKNGVFVSPFGSAAFECGYQVLVYDDETPICLNVTIDCIFNAIKTP
ncbi:hypothetical protein [Shewanella algae]|uniref:hypothetical protein n=1 Tax=Shewanella algae TaxID=38313 RepID=UPI0031F48242